MTLASIVLSFYSLTSPLSARTKLLKARSKAAYVVEARLVILPGGNIFR